MMNEYQVSGGSISAAAHRCFTQQTLSIVLIILPLVHHKGTAALLSLCNTNLKAVLKSSHCVSGAAAELRGTVEIPELLVTLVTLVTRQEEADGGDEQMQR